MNMQMRRPGSNPDPTFPKPPPPPNPTNMYPSRCVVDDAMVERGCEAVARRDGIDWNNTEWQATHRIEAGRLRARISAALQAAALPAVPDAVLVLMNHIENVLPDEAFNLIDFNIWNAVTNLHLAATLAQATTVASDQPEGEG